MPTRKELDMLENDFVRASKFRHSCKSFDASRGIPGEEFESLLDVARCAPSSMGLEHTRMLVVRDRDFRERMRECCWDQRQITEASEVIIFLSLKCDLLPDSNYTLEKFQRRMKGKSSDELNEYLNVKYKKNIIEKCNYDDLDRMGSWSSDQAHIMSTVMVYYAAFLGIDSCFIGGYDRESLEVLLGIDKSRHQVSIIVCLGYRTKPQSDRLRMAVEEIVSYV